MALERSRRVGRVADGPRPARARVLDRRRASSSSTSRPCAVGARIAIRPGERIPLDAVVDAGHSSVDQAPITGESVPVDKAAGDELFAGTLNTTGALDRARRRAPAADSMLSRVAALVEEAQGSRAPAERFIDRFARDLHADRVRRRAPAGHRPAAVRRRGRHVAVPRARAADRRLPVLARDLRAGRRRLGRRRRRAPRHPDQGRPGARGSRRASARSRWTRPAR